MWIQEYIYGLDHNFYIAVLGFDISTNIVNTHQLFFAGVLQ